MERHGDLNCVECYRELDAYSQAEWRGLNCVELDQLHGRTARCDWCNERLLDSDGMPRFEVNL